MTRVSEELEVDGTGLDRAEALRDADSIAAEYFGHSDWHSRQIKFAEVAAHYYADPTFRIRVTYTVLVEVKA